jgi:hypothetical protein
MSPDRPDGLPSYWLEIGSGLSTLTKPRICTASREPAIQRLMREIFVPSMLIPAIKPCWSKMNA